MRTLVIGAGVSGLTTAIRLLEASHQVTIAAAAQGRAIVSSVAAAIWYPYKAYPQHLVSAWGATTYAELVRLIPDSATGIVLRRGRELFHAPEPDPWWRAAVPDWRRATPAELPAGYVDGFAYSTPIIDMLRYLPWLAARVTTLGGQIVVQDITDLDACLAEYDLVVDCAGLGARMLVGDATLTPIRGQVIRVAQVGLEEFFLDDNNPAGIVYIIPRIDDIVLGGTAQSGDATMEPDPATAAAILARCIALEPRLRDAAIIEHRVGLRPGRPAIRLEREQRAGGVVIHNYGHGGAGVTLSWGCAQAVINLLQTEKAP